MSDIDRIPYVVIRYHYDEARGEGVNVGVIVQTDDGLSTRLIGDWLAFHRSYPFIDLDRLQRKLASLEKLTKQQKIRVFDYDKNEALELPPSDSRLLTFLRREINHDLEATEPRFAELSDRSDSERATLLEYLYETLIEPPKPREGILQTAQAHESLPRPAHATLHRAATKKIVSVARKLRREGAFEPEPSVSGATRTWRFDLRVRRVPHFVHHVLMFPDPDETIHEAAALARIWQDVCSRHRNASLTAVCYGRNGSHSKNLPDTARLLAKDEIPIIHPDQLQGHYLELLGQKRLLN